MPDPINEYKKWKAQGENLRTEAKQAMESRFRDLLSEAVTIAQEYRSDFGVPLKPPPIVTAFRFKAAGKPKLKKAAKPQSSKVVEAPAPDLKQQKADPKVARLQRRLEAAKTKLEKAKAAGSPTRPLEDRVYEIEDELQLAGQRA